MKFWVFMILIVTIHSVEQSPVTKSKKQQYDEDTTTEPDTTEPQDTTPDTSQVYLTHIRFFASSHHFLSRHSRFFVRRNFTFFWTFYLNKATTTNCKRRRKCRETSSFITCKGTTYCCNDSS